MHRSGTSFLVRALNLAGVNLGDFSSMLSNEWSDTLENPKGHWENMKILELTQKILKENNGTWDEIPEFISCSKENENAFKNTIIELLENSILAAGIKDPRLILLIDNLEHTFPKNSIYVGIFRNPLKVAESLFIRNKFDYEKSLKLWLEYNTKLLEFFNKKHRHT